MHRLHKVSKAGVSVIAVRNIPWFVRDLLALTGLSLWIGFRGVCKAISNRVRHR